MNSRSFMSKITFQKPGNFIYPVPAVMVSLRDASGKSNIITIAWTGTICSDPPMAYISVRKSRASYPMLVESGEFVINLPSEELVRALDYCGVRSLDQVDKWKEMNLHEEALENVANGREEVPFDEVVAEEERLKAERQASEPEKEETPVEDIEAPKVRKRRVRTVD